MKPPVELSAMSDTDLQALCVQLQTECHRRVDGGNATPNQIVDLGVNLRLSVLARGWRFVWSGYAAMDWVEPTCVQLSKFDRDGYLVDLWVRCPEIYSRQDVRVVVDTVQSFVEREVVGPVVDKGGKGRGR